MSHLRIHDLRETLPQTSEHLWNWIYAYSGVKIARASVCREHQRPFDWVASLWSERPAQSLFLGPRGGGKSLLSAIISHLESRFHPGLGTRILSGSPAQVLQIHDAFASTILRGQGPAGTDSQSIRSIHRERIRYWNGSQIAVLGASPSRVCGPHLASLRFDEVDEIDEDLRDAAFGSVIGKRGLTASVSMASTWQKIGGPLSRLIERGEAGAFPVYQSCAFDVLESCPEARSGRKVGGLDAYENCPICPLRPWCHSERDRNGGIPLAKLADGHYPIETLIQKVRGVSPRVFETDYLGKRPRGEGMWFQGFDPSKNVSIAAAYNPKLPVHLAIDSGVFTAAVAFQVSRPDVGGPTITVFMDFLAEGVAAEPVARSILDKLDQRFGVSRTISTDPSGGSRNPVGPTVLAEYERAGLSDLVRWPVSAVAPSLALLDSLIATADGSASLLIHPTCRALIVALENYRRAKRGGQWQDVPEDPQHPHEDLVDALRGGLKIEFPELVKPLRKRRSNVS